MAEMFTLQRLKLPPSLYKCLATTNLIESLQRGVARGTANVKYWRDQEMVERWLDNRSIRCFSNTGIDFSIKEV
jgi:putative transposase